MSYILAALKKADTDRRSKQGLTLDDLGAESNEKKEQSTRTSVLGVPLIALSLGGLLVLGLFLMPPWIDRSSPPEMHSLVQEEISPGTQLSASLSGDNNPSESNPSLPAGLTIQGIVFVESRPESSRVIIQGKSYRQGEEIIAGIRISSIGESMITLSNGQASQNYFSP